MGTWKLAGGSRIGTEDLSSVEEDVFGGVGNVGGGDYFVGIHKNGHHLMHAAELGVPANVGELKEDQSPQQYQ